MRTMPSMPNASANRITTVTIMLVGAIIFWIWEAGLISFVSVRKTNVQIRTLKDLYENSNLKVSDSCLVEKCIHIVILNESQCYAINMKHERHKFDFSCTQKKELHMPMSFVMQKNHGRKNYSRKEWSHIFKQEHWYF